MKHQFRITRRELILEDIFYSLTNLVKDAIIVADSSRKIVYWNKASERIFRYQASEILGKSLSTVLLQDVLSFSVKSSPSPKEKFIEVIGRKKNGQKIPLEISRTYWESEKGHFFTLIIRDVTIRKNAEEKLKYMSFHDNLTGLYNRSYFEEELQRLNTARQLPLSIIIGDIDGFKLVNDAFGYKQGDELLKNLAKVLKDSCRSEDMLARWGGDEFVILLPKTDIKGIQEIISRIQKKSREVSSGGIPLNISLGFATKEKSTDNIDRVIKEAEDSMKQKKLIQSKKVSNEIIASIEKKLRERSRESGEAYERIKNLALILGKALKLQKSDLDNLALLSDFHDIGKVTIKTRILTKKSKLAEEEWQIMKMHPEIGYRIAKSSVQLAQIADAILAHHENWDGTGYPYKLKGNKIPVISRIVAIVEAYDVMVCGRNYKKAVSKEQAIKELRRCSRKQFDPQFVSKFIEIMEQKEKNLSLFP